MPKILSLTKSYFSFTVDKKNKFYKLEEFPEAFPKTCSYHIFENAHKLFKLLDR